MMTRFTSKEVREALKNKGFSKCLKKCRKKYGNFSAAEAAEAAAMPLRTYLKYESGEVTPKSIAHAAGLLFSVYTPEREIHRLLFEKRLKKLRPAPLKMTQREEALIQWFDSNLERSMAAQKPLAAIATLCYALELKWVPWRSAPELCKYLESNGVEYSREAVRKRSDKIKASFKTALTGK